MIGMVAFIIETPDSFTSAATAMPVQIFMWSDSAEEHFMRSSLAILFLVGFLIAMNSLAVVLRRKFEKMVKSNNFKFKTNLNVFYGSKQVLAIYL